MDSDNEDHTEDEEIERLIKELSILRIEVRKWRSQVERCQEGMVSLAEHRKTIRELKERWAEELMFQKLRWEEIQKELKEMKKFKSMQVEKDQLYTLSQELLGTKVPSSSYPVFLFEQFIWFKLRAVKEGRPYEIATSAKFLESDFKDQNLLCELYLHELACPLDCNSNLVPFSGDDQLRDFASFVSNHVQWERYFQNFSHNEAHSNIWIRSEPQNPRLLLARHQSLLSCPIQTRNIMEL